MQVKKLGEISSKLQKLIGQEIRAFGKDSQGCWGYSDDIKIFTIKDISYEDGLLNVYLAQYNSTGDDLIYTDPRFEEELKSLFKKFELDASLDYSEAGMQGDDFVNFDCYFN